MRTLRQAWLTLVALGILTTASAAQEDSNRRREGFWMGFGFGGGWNDNATFDGSTSAGMGVYARVGGTISQKLLLGFETTAWIDAQVARSVAHTNATLSAIFYPSRSAGLFLKGGIGVAYFQMATPIGTGRNTGIGSTWGLGYDIPLGRSLSLTPSLGLMVQSFESGATESTNKMTLFTLGLSWH